ncbi:MAG: DUF2207 domain-containing protein [Desulfobaccales bacterium]
MKTPSRALFLALAAVCLFPLLAAGAPPRPNQRPWSPPAYTQEKILRFQSLVQVHPDATLTVTETIKVQSAGVQIKRGIVRDFPTIYRDKAGNTVKVGFEVLEVLRDGKKEPYHLQAANNGVKIFIGQKDVVLPSGVYEYTIKYRTDRQLGFFPNYDELYWNVTGHGWTFPINSAQAVIELPPGAQIMQYSAYTGRKGGHGRDYNAREEGPGKMVFTATRDLPPGSGLTVAVAWPKGVVHPPSDTDKMGFFVRDHLPAAVGLAGFLLVLGFYLTTWYRVGRDPAKGTIIPLFAPPPGFSPPSVRYLLRMGFDDRAVAAALVDMAVKGFLTIENVGKAYTLHKKGGGTQAITREEQDLGSELFAGGDTLEMKDRNYQRIQGAREALKEILKREIEKAYFFANSNYFAAGVLLSLLAVGAVFLASLNGNSSADTILYLAVSAGVCCLGAFWLIKKGGDVSVSAFTKLRNIGTLGIGAAAFGFFLVKIWGAAVLRNTFPLTAVILALLLVGLNFLFYRLLKAPTLTGRKIMDQIEGFRLYLSVAEKERLDMLNPPEKTPELFEKYLPYALALDVENQWSEQFAAVLARAGDDGRGYSPVWYTGSYHDLGNTRFVSNLGGAFAGAIAASSSPPGSSSGSGGGGSSGGGGGGGGGSGW